MNLSIVEKCNIVLEKFGFPPTIKTISHGDISIVNRGKTAVIQGNTVVVPEPYFWYYLNITNANSWNFIFGKADKKQIFKWSSGNQNIRLSNKFITGVKKEVNRKVANIKLNKLGDFIC